jgi:ElaB/YqjD/DUF883 family membrane-anchored ribosome-binding protein
MSFTDRMASFTEHLKTSIQERDESLAETRHAAQDVLKAAQEFVTDVAADHRVMGEALHAELTADREARSDCVAEMRHQHKASLDQMRDEMQTSLDATRQARQEAVHQMREAFTVARCEVAADLQGAAKAWKAFAARRQSCDGPEPRPEAHSQPQQVEHPAAHGASKPSSAPQPEAVRPAGMPGQMPAGSKGHRHAAPHGR